LLASSRRHFAFSSPVSDSQLDDDGAELLLGLGLVLLPLSVALCANAPKASTDPRAAAINCNFMNISLKWTALDTEQAPFPFKHLTSN
jgi:hypothetical protein